MEISEVIKESLEKSTLHGIPNIITKSNHWSMKVIWAMSILISVSTCAWYLSTTTSSYLEFNVVTDFRVNHAFQLPFPVISICDRNRKGIK